MRLADLLRSIDGLRRGPSSTLPDIEVRGLAYDSRQVVDGEIFIALAGLKTAGAGFAASAVSRGAVAVIADIEPAEPPTVPWIVVNDARQAMAVVADEFYGHPSRSMTVVGITGTNGKTTTAYLIRSVFEAAGMKSGMIGTVTYLIDGKEIEAPRTTPESPDLQRLLRTMLDSGCKACVTEVSSHALALRRVDGTRFAAGVFTNLTRDHLDYHQDMESYFSAKRRLFEMLPEGAPAIINLDDPRGEVLRKFVSRPVTFAMNRSADVVSGPLQFGLEGLEFDVQTPRGAVHVQSRLVGRPNVANILAAVATTSALDVPLTAIERGLAELEGVPGRFQVVSQPADDITVIVDYAHTDDALKSVLETARPLARARVVTVFGCGGDRDRTKRPLMGAVASRLSDVVVITSDNPRSEDPARIIEEVKRGITSAPSLDRGPAQVVAIVDRHEAIDYAISNARAGDLVLLAGKGHEKTQVVGDRILPFDEQKMAREALERRSAGSRVQPSM